MKYYALGYLPALMRSLVFLILYSLLFGATLLLGRFVDAQWDINLLLLGNPDHYIPGLDELAVFQTDFVTLLLSLTLIAWQIGYYSSRGNNRRRRITCHIFHGIGIALALLYMYGLFLPKGHVLWVDAHEYKWVFPMGALAAYGFFRLAGLSFVRLDDTVQRRLAMAFWLTLLAVVFTNLIGEDYIKKLVGRHRPLHDSYAAWNTGIRIINDEIIRGSHSYISGHASSFFTLVGVYFWMFRSRKIKAFLFLWAAFHAYTRVYTAAHFPYCVIMGSIYGFLVATMLYYLVARNHEPIDPPWRKMA